MFALAGVLLLGIGRHLAAVGVLAHATQGDRSAELEHRWRRLARHMLGGGLIVLSLLLLITYTILARIDQGFAVFG